MLKKAISEFLILDDNIRPLILERQPASIINRKAIELGMKTLKENGWQKISEGLTTVSEVLGATEQSN